MTSLRYASYLEEEDWDIATLQVVNAHLQRLVSMLPGGGADLTIAELQGLAAQQQAAMETQQQALVARETRLKYLQQQEARNRQLASEQLQLQRMKERVEAQELKLRKLRAVRGQVDQFKASNGNLNTELEAVRVMFNEKEKELAFAVSKVDQLMRQLQEFKEVKTRDVIVHGYKSGENMNLELEKLKKELVHRHKQNEQQHVWLEGKQRLLQQRKDEVSTMDSRILELQQLLKKQRTQQRHSVANTINQKTNSVSSAIGIVQHKSGQNIATVEPYIQNAKDVAADDQTMPTYAKFGSILIPDDSSKSRSPGLMKEVNNNSKNVVIGQLASANDSNVNGVQPVEYKMPSLISTHFDAQRVRVIASNQQMSAVGQKSGKGVTQHQTPLFPFSGDCFMQPSTNNVVKGSRTVSNPGLPKWPPEPVKDKEQVSRQPQINIFDEERQAGSGQSSPASSEGSGPLAQQGLGVFTHPPTSSPPIFNTAVGPPVPQRMSHTVNRQGPPPPPRPPQGMAAVKPVISTAQDGEHASHTAGTASCNKDADCSKLTFNNLLNLGQPQASLTPTTVAAAPATQGLDYTESKIASGIHLNQRPAPTYRNAPKTVIANTYMGRLGNVAMERYQLMNKQIYNLDSMGTTQNTDTADGETSAASKNIQPPMSCDKGVESAKMTHFGIVGSPYPDIASDKGSYKINTPKHIRRRHSDSDNEELSKVLQHIEKQTQISFNNVTEDTINNNDMDISVTVSDGNNGEPTSSQKMLPLTKSSDQTNDKIDSLPVPASDGTDKKDVEVVRRKKTILKGENGRKMLNRVSFDPLALLLDASLEGELELVKRTAEEVNDVSAPNDEGITALHNAICAGHYDIVKFLVEFGADVNSPDSDGWTPLHCAASCNNLPMVRFLVDHGACIFAATISDNETAAEKCEEDEDGYDGCSDYLYSVQEKLGISNDGAVYAVFEFLANNADELSFNINHKLMVVRKGDEREKDWWWSRTASGAEGYIPKNMLGLHPRVLQPSTLKSSDTSECSILKSQDTSEC